MASTTPYTDFLQIPVTEVRDYTLPSYSFEYSEDMLGLERRRVINEDGRHSEITLFYNHLNDAEVNLFINFYNEKVPAGRGFGLPQSLLGYPDKLFQQYLKTAGKVLYFFKERPKIVNNEVAGTYSMLIKLEAKPTKLSTPSQITVILSSTATVSADTEFPVFWTQLSGQPLIFDDPYSATTLVTASAGNITNVLGDIVLRVCLLDDPSICSDININAKPVEEYKPTLSLRNPYLTEAPSNLAIPLPIQWDYISDISTATFYDNESIAFNPFHARWRFPEITTYLSRFDIEVWDGVNWVVVGSVNKNDLLTYTFGPNTVFRIVSVHSFPGAKTEVRAASKIFFIDPPEVTGDIIAGTDLFRPIASSSSFVVERDIPLTAASQIEEDIGFIRLSSTSPYLTVFDNPIKLRRYDLVAEDEMNAHYSSSNDFIQETDYDLGGVVIG